MTPPTAEQSAHLSTLEDMAAMLQKAQVNMKKCPKSRLTEGYIKVRCKSIESYWDTFKQAHNALSKCTPREQKGQLPYFLKEEFYKIADLYLCLQGDLTDLLAKLESQNSEDVNMSSVSQCSQSTFPQLPRIQLPIFGGKYEDWPTYQDLFVSLVHNTSLNNVQKLYYLKTSISGEAEILLRHIQITENSYEQAWELLKRRFGNKKMIVTSLLKRLFGQKKISNQSSGQIKSVLDTTAECINTLNHLGIKTDSWDPVIIFLVSQKLDTESLKDWEEHAYKEKRDELSTWKELKQFLESKFRTLELAAPLATFSKDRPQLKNSFHMSTTDDDSKTIQSGHANFSSQPSCSFCKGDHYIFHCKEFAQHPVQERRQFAKENRLCYNCLVPNHNVFTCKQKTTCRVCKRRHHSLLHEVRQLSQEKVALTQPEQKFTTAHFSKNHPGHKVLLATAQVEVRASNGDMHTLRALIDQGSEASFVSARAADLLNLRKSQISGFVTGVGEGTQIPVKYAVDLICSSRFNKSESIQVKAYVLKKISTNLPSQHISLNWLQLKSLELADPTYYQPSSIDLLLGIDVFCKIIEEGLVRISDCIVAQKTILGWILSGQWEDKTLNNHCKIITFHIKRMVADDNDMLKRFWEIETDLYKKKKILKEEEALCEELYKRTTKRHESGKYIVHLPLRKSIEETVKMCGDTKYQAEVRFKHLERKFQKNPNFKIEYAKVIQEYKEMGHMKRKESSDGNKDAIYLPHHAVVREDKDTSRVRVVFDASAKGSNGHSLNDTMLIGPVLQPDLRSLIISWRKHKICVIGDIVKMYRMIMMTEEHTNLQRIFWRDTPDQELETYNLQTVTFGTAAAPYLAVRTLHQLADDETREYPDTAPAIKQSFYMDDLMMGNDNIEKTKIMCEQIRTILNKGGFKMQKWSSNSEEILEYLQGENSLKEPIEIKLDKVIRILGLTWDRKQDAFRVTVNLPKMTQPITKRSVLSDVARLFDPFGWLSPVIIAAKVFIQKLWVCNLEWDDELPSDLREEWTDYRQGLTYLEDITIPRWFKTTPNNYNDIQVHGFADASTKGYAAVAYLRIVKNDIIHVTLIASRTKVAPLKQLSVPKLELSAAALLTELIGDIMEILEIPKDKIFAWTDSMIVLAWLQAHPSRWRTFVANRVADITRVLSNDRWRHVDSSENPADIATRSIMASDLAFKETWWAGPKWLSNKYIEFDKCDVPTTEVELKGSFHASMEEKPIWERFSTLSRMKRVLAYCRRFCKKRASTNKVDKYLTSNEMEHVLECCVRYYQNFVYGEEIEDLKMDGRVKRRSCLITLLPFLDDKGLIRVGGRLQNASIPEITKHPIIIPRNLHITKLIIQDAHYKTLHGGIQLMMAYVRTKYWVIGLKSMVRKCIHQCKICVVSKAKAKYQLMGQLPAVRVNQNRAFMNSGVDYAGPVLMRTTKGRGHHATKGYICLFVCMATRAIHLEAVTDLTSQAFIAAFRRFVGRRGHCSNLYSDNATNFVGAAKELKDMFQRGMNNVATEIAEILANDGTTWHFIPPRMPSYGGLWESGVRSVKRHLIRVTRDTKLTYEEMATLLIQIEACLNSRPLCKMDDTSDTPLTPGHFLVGEPLIGVPDCYYELRTKNIGLLTRWQYIQRMTQDFWHRWRTEYLNTLQQRYKWQVTVPSPAVGDLVIIKDEDLAPTKWLMGRIKYVHPGSDNLVRVVTVQCKGNQELKRPLSKIIPLPKESEIQ